LITADVIPKALFKLKVRSALFSLSLVNIVFKLVAKSIAALTSRCNKAAALLGSSITWSNAFL